MTEEYKKEVCQCRSCNNMFHQKEIEHKYTERSGQQALETVCPHCGENTYGLVKYPIDEYELIYKNSKFFGMSNELKRQYEWWLEENEYSEELHI